MSRLPFANLKASAIALALVGSTPALSVLAADDEPSMAPPEDAAAVPSGDKSMGLKELGITGSARGSFWSSNRRSNDESNLGVGQLWAKLDKKVGHGVGLFAEGYVGKEDLFGDRVGIHRLREAYVDYRYNEWDFRVGKQIVAWGRTDRLNPTDNLTPRDFTLLSPEFDEDRFGTLAARVSFNWGLGKSLTAVWLPGFESNTYSFANNSAVTYNHTEPGSRRQYGLKYDVSSGGVDWSVSYYDGFDLSPDFSLSQVTSSGKVVNMRHNRIKVLGADAATTVGANRYAVEVAYTKTQDSDGNDPAIKNPHFYGVVGLEHDFTDNLTGIVQYFYRHVFHFQPVSSIANPDVQSVALTSYLVNSQYDENLHGLNARVGKKWFNETLEGEFAGAVLLNRQGYFLRSKVSYIWSDNVKLIGGYEYYSGASTTSYGGQQKNKALFAEARYFF